MSDYVPPRYIDPNYLSFDDFERQQLKRGLIDSYYEQAQKELAGEAYIKAANQQAFKYSEARRAIADAMGTQHAIPATDVVVPQSTPGVVSSTGAKAIASAARSTGAQSARVLKTAATETVEQLARNPKTVAGALPIVGAVAAGVFEAAGSRAAGRTWGDSVSRGIGGAIGGQFGWSLGSAGAAASGFNPIPSAAATVGGGVLGQFLGARAGSAVYSGLTGKIPGTIPWALRKALDNLPGRFGGENRGDDSPAENPALQQQNSDLLPAPNFSGGQTVGANYVVFYKYTPLNLDGSPQSEVQTSAFNLIGPIGGIKLTKNTSATNAPESIVITHNGGEERGVNFGSVCPNGCFQNASITSIVMQNGQPDTGGDPAGTVAPRPQTAPRPNSPIYNPQPAQPDNTPPTSNPTQPSAPTAPGDLENDDKPLIPPIVPAGSPTPSPLPTITPNPVTPTGSPSAIPNQSNGTNPARSGSASGATDTAPLDTDKDTDTIRINNPEGSGQTFKIPGYPDLKPNETIEIEDTEDNRAIARAIYAALAGVIVGGGILAARKVADLNKTSTQTLPVDPPAPTPPQNPTDTGCRCNTPILSKLDEFEKKLGLDKIVSGAGDASVMAYLIKMQAFAAKAWEVSRIQKVLNALTLVTVLHNASMISRDVGETLGYALAQGLDVLGIEDEEGNTLDVNGWFGTQANNFFENIFGAERWHGLNQTWNKANRIISSASAIVWTIRSINDGTQEVLEWTAENTGKIGNALKKWGVVGERAYGPMAERVKAQDAYRRKFSRILDGLDTADDAASSFAQVTGNFLEITEEVGEFREQRENFKTAVRDLVPGAYPDNSDIPATNDEAKANATAGPQITPADMEPSTSGTP